MNQSYVTDHENLSDTERRNIEHVHHWAAAYKLPGGSPGRLVDEIYSENPEVVSVLTDTHVARAGESKHAWRAAEFQTANLVKARRVLFDALHAATNVVTVEGRIEQHLEDGTVRGWPFAAVLYFDADGRIFRDHTYMLPPPHQHEFERAAELAGATAKLT